MVVWASVGVGCAFAATPHGSCFVQPNLVRRHPGFEVAGRGSHGFHCALSGGGGDGSASVESDSERLRAEYVMARAQREEPLLKSGLNRMDDDLAGRDDVRPDFITRWGGADLANEGPTRKMLELMSDSEWYAPSCISRKCVILLHVSICFPFLCSTAVTPSMRLLCSSLSRSLHTPVRP